MFSKGAHCQFLQKEAGLKIKKPIAQKRMAQGGMPAAGFTPVVRVSAGERRSGAAVMRIGGLMLTAVCAVLAVAAISTRGSSTADRTELDMLKGAFAMSSRPLSRHTVCRLLRIFCVLIQSPLSFNPVQLIC